MTVQAIRELLEEGKSFQVLSASGKTYPVPHPDYASLSPTGRLLTIYDDQDGAVVLDVALLLGVETSAAAGTA
jgi:hypothetical protein